MMLISIFRPLVIAALRLSLGPMCFQTCLKVSLVDVISMSQRRDPRQYLRGEPRVQFHLNTTFPGRENTVRERSGEEPIPNWKLAHRVKESGLCELLAEGCAGC